MNILVCPGINKIELTNRFVQELSNLPGTTDNNELRNILVFPQEGILNLSAWHILRFLGDRLGNKLESPIVFISFSAGVVGAIAAAKIWQIRGGNVKAFIAIDGWGVPLIGNFPIHRLSHDYFTHWTSVILGMGEDNFYANPPVEHLSMWRSPQKVQGYWVNQLTEFSQPQISLNACEFLNLILKRYK
ncbi:MAG: hypothetical protein EAZ76_10410 [Nostocales cyanobacterium]|nr:MAG: hypothetical protein EAZ87_20295 [Nostocales cyanobacterium]TAF13999.1 MAG: hypothetical protein EAZ76_10410 [Nostocales cyanobacterium]